MRIQARKEIAIFFISVFILPVWIESAEVELVYSSTSDLSKYINTEDDQLNDLIYKVYSECLLNKLFKTVPPTLNYTWFSPLEGWKCQYLWDTMFMVINFSPLDNDQVIRDVFENYWWAIENNPEAPKGSYRYGMVPIAISENWPPMGISQIPILAWGCNMVYRMTNDRTLIERCLPYLVVFDEWFSSERDTDGDGLIEYGAYKYDRYDPVQCARFETFDKHVSLDSMKLTKHPRRNSGGEWYGNVEGVEQTSFVILSERAIVEMARELGQNDLAERYEKIVAKRVKAMQTKMWDPETKFFYSLYRDTDEQIRVRTLQGFLTLTCEAATSDQAASLAQQLKDPKRWWSSAPVTTCAMDEPSFDPKGYWRGDMWPPTNYLITYGLNLYGHNDIARELTEKTSQIIVERGLNEYYHGLTGEPLGVPGAGFASVVLNMIIQDVYGVQGDFRTIRIPSGAKGKRLLLGKLELNYPEDNIVEICSKFERKFSIIFPEHKGEAVVICNGVKLKKNKVKVSGNQVIFTAEPGKTYLVSRLSE